MQIDRDNAALCGYNRRGSTTVTDEQPYGTDGEEAMSTADRAALGELQVQETLRDQLASVPDIVLAPEGR